MRYRDRAAHHERDVEGVHELCARDAAIRALLDVISNAIVATQDNRGRESHQLLRFLVERAVFVSLRVERKESFDAQVAAVEQLFVHFGAIKIELIHQAIPFTARKIAIVSLQVTTRAGAGENGVAGVSFGKIDRQPGTVF